MTPEEVAGACRQAGVRLVRFLYCDNGGGVGGRPFTSTGWRTACARASA
jgi:hypothetical protein